GRPASSSLVPRTKPLFPMEKSGSVHFPEPRFSRKGRADPSFGGEQRGRVSSHEAPRNYREEGSRWGLGRPVAGRCRRQPGGGSPVTRKNKGKTKGSGVENG